MAIKFAFVTMLDLAHTEVPDVKIRNRAVGVHDLESNTVAFRYQDLIVGPAAKQPVSRVFAGAEVLRNSHAVEAVYEATQRMLP